MNIGIVTTWFERGAAYVSRAYLETLSEKHKVFIYARAGEKTGRGDPHWDGDYVTWGNPVPGKMLTHIDEGEFRSWVEQRQLELVIFNEQISWDIIPKARALPICIGAYIDYYLPATVPFFRLYDFVLCNTRRHYSVFKDHPQAYYIPWGTDIRIFYPRQKPGQTGEVVIFHSCGISPYRKGTDILIRAFTHVKGQARLIIHIQSLSQQWPPRPTVQEMVDKAGDKRIELIEAEVGAPGLYYLGDIYAYPTRLEGIGLTISEALACGLPVVTTSVAPVDEFVQPEENGRLVKVARQQIRSDDYYWPETICDPADLAQALQYYVDRPGQLPEFRKMARMYAEQYLDWRKNSHDLPELIEGVQRVRDENGYLLEQKVVAYEQSRYRKPYPAALQPVVTLLAKTGAGQLHRWLKKQLNASKRKVGV